MLLYFINIGFISTIYAQIFEFDAEDYYEPEEIEEKNPRTNSEDAFTTNSKDIENKPSLSSSSNSEDADKETCIEDGQILKMQIKRLV